jgi:sugar (pentulose or hexulose) kinase
VISEVFLGIDIGTSGVRGSAINEAENEIASYHIAFENTPIENTRSEQNPATWSTQLDCLISEISRQIQQLDSPHQIVAITIDGTSSTLIACKNDGTPLSPAMMYNDQQSHKQAEIISRFAPIDTAVHSASSSLAKALFLLDKHPETELFCHQADWLAASLTGQYGISDENNCLKLGYDSVNQCWPEWLFHNNENTLLTKDQLPTVISPGTKMGTVTSMLIEKYQLAAHCNVFAGTTDSIAAVLATGAKQLGDAVTSLGSTLVIKLFSDKPIFNPEYGIYSHRLHDQWLVGGASNSGGSVLLQHFTAAQLKELTEKLNPDQLTGLDYYPLPATGERFPVNDKNKKNNTEPRPTSDVEFFQALLEGIANIESEGYKKLESLGATPPKRIYTAGGGSNNLAWRELRAKISGINIVDATHSEACYGSALLAKSGYTDKIH